MSSESELDAIRRRKMQELQMQLAAEQQRTEQQQAVDAQKKAVLRQILTTEARQRLSRIKLVKPSYAEQLELQLIQAAQTRRIKIPITDDQLKGLLSNLQTQKREFKVRRI
jgi:programmed cell death protein 5